MAQTQPKTWPFSGLRSTGDESQGLLQALLATATLDEISNVDDFSAVERYAISQGKADRSGKITEAFAFWVYPTGMNGPYHRHHCHHETEDDQIRKHGVLLTVEPGVEVVEVVEMARLGLKEGQVRHEHVGMREVDG